MKTSTVIAISALATCAIACDKLKGSASEGTTTSAASGGTALGKAADTMKADKTSTHDGPIKGDGANDGAFTLSVDGPVSALVLITTDAAGKAEHGQQWDTYTGEQVVPEKAETSHTIGNSTWMLAVYENGKLMNDAKGSLTPLGAGPHKLTLYASESGFFGPGDHAFRVIVVRPDGAIVKSNVFKY